MRISQLKKQQILFSLYVLLPILALYTYLRFIPIGRTIVLSFLKWDLLSVFKPFIGINNYIKLLHSPQFLMALKNTFIFTVVTVPVQIAIAMALAVALNSKKLKLTPFYQTIYFIPVMTSMVPVAVVWKWIYDPTYGILNYILSLFGFKKMAWLINPQTALLSICVMNVWKLIGYSMVILLVGIKNISPQYYDSASIDGANGWEQFVHITLPLLKPITLFVMIIATIRSLQVFTQVYVMTLGSQGAPGNVVRVVVYEIYQNAFEFFKMGYASAQAMVLFIVVVLLTLAQFRIAREK